MNRRYARFLFLATILCAVSTAHGAATDACWEVVVQPQPLPTIKLNKCTGKTWLLLKHPLVTSEGVKTGTTAYSWSPVMEDHNEAVFVDAPTQ
jgi:hypothetical protein